MQKSKDVQVEQKGSASFDEHRAHTYIPRRRLRSHFLTYVLWTITPEGRTVNLQELIPRRGRRGGQVDVTTAVATSCVIN